MSGRILVIGRSGQLAEALQRLGGGRIEAWGRSQLDLTERDDIAAKIASSDASAVINAAAYTAVDQAESEPDLAHAVNAAGPTAVARACAALGTPFLYVSSDYVFDGAKTGAYVEGDARRALSAYGRSKIAGEDGALAHGGTVLRTSWLFAARGNNFVRTMLRLAKTREEVSVVADQIGRPTWADDLAHVCLALAERRDAGGEVFHFAGADDASWADLAEGVFSEAAARNIQSARVRRIISAGFPTAAARPLNSRLDSSKSSAFTGIVARPWRDALKLCFDQIAPR